MVFKGEPKAGVSNLPLTNTWVFYNQSDTKIPATTGSHFTLQLTDYFPFRTCRINIYGERLN